TQKQQKILTWAGRYVNLATMQVTDRQLPHVIIAAQRKMYLRAAAADEQLWASDRILTSPARWAHCGPTSLFLNRSLFPFGVPVNLGRRWFAMGNDHLTTEIYFAAFGKFVYYDPLYGVVLLRSDGVPASLEDILSQWSQFGQNLQAWQYQPYRISDLWSAEAV